jgi:hypothetical protein
MRKTKGRSGRAGHGARSRAGGTGLGAAAAHPVPRPSRTLPELLAIPPNLTSSQIHARSTPGHRWLVALDAAAHAPTHALDLSRVKPDFVDLSFYKLFGHPTGAPQAF